MFSSATGALIVFALAIMISLVAHTPLWIMIGPLVIAPSLALASYATLAATAARYGRENYSWRDAALASGWIGLYALAWRISVAAAIHEYSQLPKKNPNCYIATAAAQGHQRFVGSRLQNFADGSQSRVNDQLAHFKAAELALRAICPPLHTFCRRVYDQIGPILAAKISRPLLADLAYLSLKPLEWLAMLLMNLLLPEAARLSRTLYRN
jgi:hypothetical protein